MFSLLGLLFTASLSCFAQQQVALFKNGKGFIDTPCRHRIAVKSISPKTGFGVLFSVIFSL
jgi:hypothetical protein